MITIFVVLGIVLLAVPTTVVIFIVSSKVKDKKQAEMIKNATTTKTTVKQGPNGRMIFEATSMRPSSQHLSRKQSFQRNPVLPYTQQQANKVSRPKSLKDTWQRLSRPFSATPDLRREEDQVELTQNSKPTPLQARRGYQAKDPSAELVSPSSPSAIHISASGSSWNTIENAGSDPISPVSEAEINSTSSITGTTLQLYQRQTIFPSLSQQALHLEFNKPLHNVAPKSVTHESSTKAKPRRPPRGLDLGAARGFMPPKSTIGHDRNAANNSSIKRNIVDASRLKINKVQLSDPPKAKMAEKREQRYGPFV